MDIKQCTIFTNGFEMLYEELRKVKQSILMKNDPYGGKFFPLTCGRDISRFFRTRADATVKYTFFSPNFPFHQHAVKLEFTAVFFLFGHGGRWLAVCTGS